MSLGSSLDTKCCIPAPGDFLRSSNPKRKLPVSKMVGLSPTDARHRCPSRSVVLSLTYFL